MNGVQIWRNILYPLILCLAVSLVTTVIIRRKDFSDEKCDVSDKI